MKERVVKRDKAYLADGLEDIELLRPVLLLQHTVRVLTELGVETLEQVFEEKREQLTSQLETLVTVVILIVDELGVTHGHEYAAHHEREVHGLGVEVVVEHGDVGAHKGRESVAGLVGARLGGLAHGAAAAELSAVAGDADLAADPVERLQNDYKTENQREFV